MLRKIVTTFLSLLIIVFLSVENILLIFSNTLLNKKYILKKLEKNNYYEETFYDIKENFKSYVMQSGLEEGALDDLIEISKIEKDVNLTVECIFENKSIEINTDDIKNNLDNKINEILKQKNRNPDKEEIQSIQTFEDTIVETYLDGIVYSEKYIEKIGNVFANIKPIIIISELSLLGLIIISFCIICLINKKIRKNLISFGTILVSSGILQMIIKVLIGNKMKYILILSSTFSKNLIAIAYSIVNITFLTGLSLVFIGIIAMIIGCQEDKQ